MGTELISYIAIEDISDTDIQAHICFIKFNHIVLKRFNKEFMSTLSPYMKDINKRRFMVSCPENLPNTKKFLELLGFSMQTIHYGYKDFT